MDSGQGQAFLDLQIKVTDLESRLNLITQWITINFGENPTLPADLTDPFANPGTEYEVEHDPCDDMPEAKCPYVDDAGTVTTTRHQLSSFQGSVFESIPVDPVIVKEEAEEVSIHLVNLTSILNSTSKQGHACTICDGVFLSQNELETHKMTHCYVQITALDFNTVQQFIHESKKRPKPKSEPEDKPENMNLSTICTQTILFNETPTKVRVKKFKKLKRFVTNFNTDEDASVCSLCPRKFVLEANLKRHWKLSHPTELYSEPLVHQPCSLCNDGKSYPTKSLLRKHKRKAHARSSNTTCEQCGAQFVFRSSLINHIKFVHLKRRPFSCPQCNKGFPGKSELRIHLLSHSDLKLFQCQECSKSFRHKRNLKKHQKRHLKPKTHQCLECAQLFSNAWSVTKHKREVHPRMRPELLPCPKCSKRFKTTTELNNHLKAHCKPNGRKKRLNKESGTELALAFGS